ncbi:MAG: EamA family transporter [Eubacteriales bacterium]|nr:EamA family transporter [Eubacteriales bacterium]
MINSQFRYIIILLFSVFISSISQVFLKKATQKQYNSHLKEYLNPLVIFSYFLFFGTTFLTIFAYRGLSLSTGPILEATSYIYITVFGKIFFNEIITKKKIIALVFIICGIVVYALWG